MRDQAETAVFDPLFRIAEIAPAALAQRIQRTVAEQTIKPIGIRPRMAGKKLTFLIAVKLVMLLHKYKYLNHNLGQKKNF